MTALTLSSAHAIKNPVRGRINGWFFSLLDDSMHAMLGPVKTRLFAELPDTVVELGSGAGANVRYLRRGTKLVAIEPNPYMHAPLARRARARGVDLEIVAQAAERLPLPDGSVDAVLSTLVLCSVRDVDGVLAEVRRVLRPGGRFLCIEHVAAPPSSVVGRVQRAVFRPWRWFFEGCHTHRDLEAAIRAAGFGEVEVTRAVSDTLFIPIRPQIHVRATR
jgi:ubiquinone/menaquinone biosynthesis C-methylase UbiE